MSDEHDLNITIKTDRPIPDLLRLLAECVQLVSTEDGVEITGAEVTRWPDFGGGDDAVHVPLPLAGVSQEPGAADG